MRRVGILLLAVVALVAMTGPVAAQPKVTITGFVDNVTSFSHNLSTVDLNYARNGETEWYARTRVRPDITAEVGTTKFVLGIEIDSTWGQTGSQDTNVCIAACPAAGTNPQRFGTTSGWDLNTDVQGTLEVKWAYTEFNMPLVPVPTRVRLGAQPWMAQYKLATLANGDFAGINVTTQVTPMVRLHATYAQVEEASTGIRDGFPRDDDYAIIASVEVTPFKGLDIRPIYALFHAVGTTAGPFGARTNRGGIANNAVVFPLTATENRHTIGVDARWRFGAFTFDPTVFYQFGNRETATRNAEIDAWLVDLRGGWQAGPLLIEAAGIYTTGNEAGRSAASRVGFYQPIATDSSYYATWAELWALNIDYFNQIYYGANGLQPGNSIGYDKYGLIRAGLRASYALTPAFTVRTAAVANWSAEEVDTSSTFSVASGLTPVDGSGDARYLGSEIDLGFQWRFAPNVALDVVGAYLFAGNALSYTTRTDNNTNGRNPQDIQSVTARVRYSW